MEQERRRGKSFGLRWSRLQIKAGTGLTGSRTGFSTGTQVSFTFKDKPPQNESMKRLLSIMLIFCNVWNIMPPTDRLTELAKMFTGFYIVDLHCRSVNIFANSVSPVFIVEPVLYNEHRLLHSLTQIADNHGAPYCQIAPCWTNSRFYVPV